MTQTSYPQATTPGAGDGGLVVDGDDLVARARVARERLMASDLAGQARAWRLLHVCLAFTADMGRATNQIYVTHLAREAGVDRSDAGKLMRRMGALGVIEWDPAPRGSRTRVVSRVGLPAPHEGLAPQLIHPHEGLAPQLIHPAPDELGAQHPASKQCTESHGHDLSGGVKAPHGALEGPGGLAGQATEAGPLPAFLDTLSGLSPDDLRRLAEDSTPAEAAAIAAELAGRRTAPRTPREWR